jgi:hypothetical protein
MRYRIRKGYRVGIGKGKANTSGPADSQYKHGIRWFRRIRYVLREEIGECQRCHIDLRNVGRGRWAVHHRDYDRTHNTRENLELLCKKCHQEEHDCVGNLPNPDVDRVLKAMFPGSHQQFALGVLHHGVVLTAVKNREDLRRFAKEQGVSMEDVLTAAVFGAVRQLASLSFWQHFVGRISETGVILADQFAPQKLETATIAFWQRYSDCKPDVTIRLVDNSGCELTIVGEMKLDWVKTGAGDPEADQLVRYSLAVSRKACRNAIVLLVSSRDPSHDVAESQNMLHDSRVPIAGVQWGDVYYGLRTVAESTACDSSEHWLSVAAAELLSNLDLSSCIQRLPFADI